MQTKPNPNSFSGLLRSDPRYYQIAALSSLLIYGVGWLGFDIEWPQIVISLGTVLITQYACTRLFRLPSFDPRSPLISGLSLCLLLRTNSLLLALLTAVITIVSKFVFKRGRKHIFNPDKFRDRCHDDFSQPRSGSLRRNGEASYTSRSSSPARAGWSSTVRRGVM